MTLENFFRVARWRSEGRNLSAAWLARRAEAWALWIYRVNK
jgi:hypothetical protein